MKNELVELQESLRGIYDFTDLVDCQSVIRMLLIDLKREKHRTKKEESRTKHEVVDFLMKMSEAMRKAEVMSDDEVIDAVVGVWVNFNMDSKESAVIDELIRRFKKAKGIVDVAETVKA